jgi:Protein of unknown function (DUF1488)
LRKGPPTLKVRTSFSIVASGATELSACASFAEVEMRRPEGEGEIMPPCVAGIPHHRERAALQTIALLTGWEMPLVSDRKSKPLTHSNSRSIGFWMSVEGRIPIQPVRVLVSYEALSELDPTNVRDLHGALENFDQFRSQVESAASRKFERNGFDPDKYEGMPAIRLTTDDLM